MTIQQLSFLHSLVNKMLDGELSYTEAVGEVKEKFLGKSDDDFETRESALLFIEKVKDKAKVKINPDRSQREREGIYPICAVPNEAITALMLETVEAVRGGEYTPDILERLMYDYGLSEELAMYINNEAVTAVKLKTLTEDEFVAVGLEYNRQVASVLVLSQPNKNVEPIEVDKS